MLLGRRNELDHSVLPRGPVGIEVEHIELEVEDVPAERLEGILRAEDAVQLLEEVLVGGDKDTAAPVTIEHPAEESAGARLEGRKRFAVWRVERVPDVADL